MHGKRMLIHWSVPSSTIFTVSLLLIDGALCLTEDYFLVFSLLGFVAVVVILTSLILFISSMAKVSWNSLPVLADVLNPFYGQDP